MFNNTDLQRTYIKTGRLFPKNLVKNSKYRRTLQLRRHYHGSSYAENQLRNWRQYNCVSLKRMWTHAFSIKFPCSPTVTNCFGCLRISVQCTRHVRGCWVCSLAQDNEPCSCEGPLQRTKTTYFLVQIPLFYFCSFYD